MENHMFSLKDKIIVITGAGGLLGRKHAEAVISYGGIPVLLDINEKSVSNLSDDLEEVYQIEIIKKIVDITQEDQVKEFSEWLFDKFGKIDSLVNNAANNPKVKSTPQKNFSRLENFPLDTWNSDISVGLTGAFICSKHIGNIISKNPNGGTIINISSDLGLIAPDQRLYSKDDIPDELQPVKPVTYSVVKSGIIGLTRYLSTYWADKNIRCNAICPGGVLSDQPEEFLRDVSSRIPLQRLANDDEYQGVLVWMLSDSASYLNGAIIPVDGGRTSW